MLTIETQPSLPRETVEEIERTIQRLELVIPIDVAIQTAEFFSKLPTVGVDNWAITCMFYDVRFTLEREGSWRPTFRISRDAWKDAVEEFLLSRSYFFIKSAIPKWI